MTEPTPTYYTSAPVQDTALPEGPMSGIRADAIEYLYVQQETRYDGFDANNNYINIRAVYCVYVGTGSISVRVAQFDTPEDANDYVRNDTGGFLS